jgi:hypothetical protein
MCFLLHLPAPPLLLLRLSMAGQPQRLWLEPLLGQAAVGSRHLLRIQGSRRAEEIDTPKEGGPSFPRLLLLGGSSSNEL